MPVHAESLQSCLSRLRDFRLFLPNPSFANPAWEDGRPRVLILRLSPFCDVERSTPHLFLAGETRRGCPSAYVDMAFLPGQKDMRLMEEAGIPLILGTQSHRPCEDFDLLLVSNSHLLELVNLPFLFQRSGVPVWASRRDERWPLVILGGSNASAAHALLSEDGDGMVDAIFFGEGEDVVADMIGHLARLAHLPKAGRLAEAARRIEALWPAGDREREVRRARRDPGLIDPRPPAQPVLPGAEASTARLSITLGCPCLCSFCFEGHDRRPFREIPAKALVAAARRLKAGTGARTLEISSFNFNTHGELPDLLIALHRLFLRVNLMSQRVDILARTPGLLDLEIAADKRSFTLGIEGISARQRRFLHKGIEDEDITRALTALHRHRVREVKLFYILTGREKEADFAELADFVKWLKDLRGRAEAPPRMVFSFGMLVRMPFTPLRYDPPVLSEPAWRPLVGKAKSLCETGGFEFRLAHAWPEYSATQALALGEPSLHRLLAGMAGHGCVASAGPTPAAQREVQAWIQERGEALLAEKPPDHRFPFAFLQTESAAKAMHRQYLRAKAGREIAGSPSRDAAGSASRDSVPREKVQQLAGITQAKHKLVPLAMETILPREAAGLGAPWMESWLMRRFLALCPGQIDNVLAMELSLPGLTEALGPDTAWFGRSAAEITAWDADSFLQAARAVPEVFPGRALEHAPGGWTRLDVALELPAGLFPDPAGALAAFLRDAHAPVTLTRQGEALQLVVPQKTLRRKMVLEGWCEKTREGCRLRLGIGARFRLGDFLLCFEDPRQALVEVIGLR